MSREARREGRGILGAHPNPDGPVDETTFPCPRCFAPIASSLDPAFCPRCGLENPKASAEDREPLDIKVGCRAFRVMDRIAIGSICAVYRCRFQSGAEAVEGVFKIARDPKSNAWVANEASVLRAIHATPDAARFGQFLPLVEASFPFGYPGAMRHANVLRTHPEIRSPDELYTLAEVQAAYPAGLDGRDVAWIWRRLLCAIGFAHRHDIVHGAVLPMHVMIEPKGHKLILVDWCTAVMNAKANARPTDILTGGFSDWYRRESVPGQPPTPSLDVAFGARCMIELLGGDPVRADFPATVDPALRRHFGRLVGMDSGRRPPAGRVLEDFDTLIEAMWGPKMFRELTMPPKRSS